MFPFGELSLAADCLALASSKRQQRLDIAAVGGAQSVNVTHAGFGAFCQAFAALFDGSCKQSFMHYERRLVRPNFQNAGGMHLCPDVLKLAEIFCHFTFPFR